MKKIIRLTLVLSLLLFLTGCGNNKKEIKKDIENQLASIKVGEIDLENYNLYEKIHIKDSNLDVNKLDEKTTIFLPVFKDMTYDIVSIENNNNIITANVKLSVKDIDLILSEDNVISDLIIKYNNYVNSNPDADRENIDRYLLSEIITIINNSNKKIDIDANVNIFYSDKLKKWQIDLNESFIDNLLGTIENDYVIDLNDISELNKQNIDILYKEIKIIPDSNKTTRSTIANPIFLNEEAFFDNSDYFFSKEQYSLKIKTSEIIRGNNAYSIITSSDSANNKILNNNQEYILIKIKVKLEKLYNKTSSSDTVLIDDTDFSLLDENGHYYNNTIVFGLPALSSIKEGEETEGYVCFIVDKNVKTFLLFKDYMDNTIFFSN